jgi:hypothetical protein
MIRKSYNTGEIVWIYGIYVRNDVPVQGRVIHKFNLNYEGFDPNIEYYVIAVDSHIEPLIEVRTWETISQDKHGPVGGFRSLTKKSTENKILARTGINLNMAVNSKEEFDSIEDLMNEEDGEPSPDEIYAAMERSQQTAAIPPLVFKEFKKPKPRNFHRKRKP